MFYCNPCADRLGWPKAHFARSLGDCEICGVTAPCNDVPSKDLPERKPEPSRPHAVKALERRL